MAKTNKNDLRRDDPWSKKAQKEGLPSRAYYKIEEIDKKFNLTKGCKNALDLGCAPGGWSLYLIQKGIKTTAIDLLDLEINPKFGKYFDLLTYIKGDFYQNQDKLQTYAPFDIIVSDMAPKTMGNRLVDCQNSLELASVCMEFSKLHLKKGGNMLMKFFQGEDNQKQIQDQIKENFATCKFFKPTVSRNFSFEIFALGIDKLQ